MKIFIKYIAFSVLWFGHDLSTQAASDLPIIPIENTYTSAAHSSMSIARPAIADADITHTDIRTTFEVEFDVQIRRAVTLFDRIYGRTIDTTPEYLLEILDQACTFLGDGAPFRLDEPESLRVCQSFLKPLNARGRYSITRPGNFDEHSFIPRLIIPMEGCIHESSEFSEEEKIIAETYFDKSDRRIFELDGARFEMALANPLMLKFFFCSDHATRLKNPIERKRDRNYCKKRKANKLRALYFFAFKTLIVVIRFAVCGKLYFRTNFTFR
jgi:hypothetical protein